MGASSICMMLYIIVESITQYTFAGRQEMQMMHDHKGSLPRQCGPNPVSEHLR